jgi:hypothetical protein
MATPARPPLEAGPSGGAERPSGAAPSSGAAAPDAPRPLPGDAAAVDFSTGSPAIEDAASTETEEPCRVGSREREGWVPIVVRFAPEASWRQRTLWVDPTCSSDDLKWWMRSRGLGGNCSCWRVHSGWRGTPYDRFTPVSQPPPNAAPDEQSTVLVIAPSFGP